MPPVVAATGGFSGPSRGAAAPTTVDQDRYHRQVLLPQVGPAGQTRLAASHALLVGCGALGGMIAEQLVRAGVGSLRVVDRDVVEETNLQRQVLFDEADAREGLPKAVAAQRRLAEINSRVAVEAVVADVHSGNVESLAGFEGPDRRADLVLDGTDNVETRYLINDACVKHGVPWAYGACVGTEGRVMPVLPGRTACLRCVFPAPPTGSELPTCDTAGVLGPVAGMVASLQAVMAIQMLAGRSDDVQSLLWVMDPWAGRMRAMSSERVPDCPTCDLRRFEFLERPAGQSITLCGRRSVQVRPAEGQTKLDLDAAAAKLARVGEVVRTPYLVRCKLAGGSATELTLFSDGRLIVTGTTDRESARSLYARFVGA